MIRILRFAALLLVLAPAVARAQPSACIDKARTQLDMNMCAADEYAVADSVLNAVYRQVVAELDSAHLAFLREAQRAWIPFRDADCALEGAEFAGGSIRPMIEMMCLTRETRRRTGQLRTLLPARAEEFAEARSGVLQATDALFQAMHQKDAAALDSLLHPRAQIVSVSDRGVTVRAADEWIRSVSQNPAVLRERMWDARVDVDGGLATLWAPYDFHLGERFSHCGIDAFQFVRVGGAWKLISVAFTGRTTGCERAP